MSFKRAEIIFELRREVRQRRRVYPGLILRGRLSSRNAERRIAILEFLIAKLQAEPPDPLPLTPLEEYIAQQQVST